MTVAGSSRSAPRTAIDRIVPGSTGASGAGGGTGLVSTGTAVAVLVSWASTGVAQPPRIVPTRSTAPIRLAIAFLLETTRFRPLLKAPASRYATLKK
jgi:hypothetical protein